MNGQQDFTNYTLPQGLRIVCAPGQTDVAYLGIAVDAGTRDELPSECGMAHLTEHMSFKGTGCRSKRQVISSMERVGGELNAFTGKEETVYYCTCPARYALQAADLLLDIVLGSTYPQEELGREVEVVADEIESYQDQPSELIFDEAESLLFPSHPLGRNILGDAATLRTFRSADVQAFAHRLYRPGRMVLYAMADVSPERLQRVAERALTRCAEARDALLPPTRRVAPQTLPDGGAHVVRRMQTHQAHVIVGAQAFGTADPRHLHLSLLNNILGGPAMSSRLNMALRERSGLVYTVESNVTSYTDAGLWMAYYGCDAQDRARCRRLVGHELDRLTQCALSQRTLDAARRQFKGQIDISCDNFESVAIGQAKRFLHFGRTISRQELFRRLDDITPADLLQTARQVFSPDRLLTLEYV